MSSLLAISARRRGSAEPSGDLTLTVSVDAFTITGDPVTNSGDGTFTVSHAAVTTDGNTYTVNT